MNNVIIHDTLEAFIKDDANNKVYFLGLTTSGSIAQTVDQEPIRAGIGGKVVSVIQSNKNIEFTITTGVHYDDVYEIQSNSLFTNEVVTIQKAESAKLVGGKLTINGTPVDGKVIVLDRHGKTVEATYADGEVTVTGGQEGAIYTVIYGEEVTADVLNLESDKFPKNYTVQLHGIAYDADTNEVVADVYWIFDKALPNGAFTANYGMGENKTDEITFTAQVPIGSNSYGKYVVVPRTQA